MSLFFIAHVLTKPYCECNTIRVGNEHRSPRTEKCLSKVTIRIQKKLHYRQNNLPNPPITRHLVKTGSESSENKLLN